MSRPAETSPPGQSIKTRVEAALVAKVKRRLGVRLDNPLKQGLKLGRIFDLVEKLNVRLDNPLKQGLKRGAP